MALNTASQVLPHSIKGLGVVFIQDRRLRADVLFIRAQSAIGAGGAPSAQVRLPQFELSSYVDRCRRAVIARSRAPTVFSARIRSASVQKTRL
jgi:hypothetical protein